MTPYFPKEILESIFQRLPIKSPIHCMSLCKYWKSIITNHSFIHYHLSYNIQSTNNNNNGSFFLQYASTKGLTRWNLEFEEFYSYVSPIDYYSILSNDPTFIIINPSIRKYVVLPNPVATLESMKQYNPDRTVLGFGFDSKSRDFKVLKIVFHHLERAALQVDIYSLTTGKWRNITHKVPSLCFKWRTNRQVIVNGNSLALAECSRLGNKIDVFVMKEYGVVSSWDLILSIDSSRYGGISSRVLGMTRNNGDFVLQTLDHHNIILWDPKKDLWKELELLEEECTVSFVGDHVESLDLINQENNVSFR
ncbi:hypothetical protein K1719_040241 [Acacia pycnantha]|nr:hypothetical protein K1719_040241 [Acacia pycnantha]